MTLRIVSITHPLLGGAVGTKRLELLADAEVTILAPHECNGIAEMAGAVRRISMPTRGRCRRARFPSLAAALDLLDPHVVHLQAEPDTSLALQVARLCGRSHGRGLVLETPMNVTGISPTLISARRARRTLSCTHAVVAHSASALASLRRFGFDGVGFVAGRGLEPQKLPDADAARRLLHIAPDTCPVIGWVGPLGTKWHVADLLEAVALCDHDVVVVIPAASAAYVEVLDRADALEILHRVRFAAPERPAAVGVDRPDVTAFPTMLAAVDALLIAPPEGGVDRTASLHTVEFAHIHAIPVIHADLPEIVDMVGAGGWAVPFRDPPLIARLFDELHARPRLLATASAAANANAQARHSPQAAAAILARAIDAAAAASDASAAKSDGRSTHAAITLALNRQPGSP